MTCPTCGLEFSIREGDCDVPAQYCVRCGAELPGFELPIPFEGDEDE